MSRRIQSLDKKLDFFSNSIGKLFFLLIVGIILSKFFYILNLVPIVIGVSASVIIAIIYVVVLKHISRIKKTIIIKLSCIEQASYKKLLLIIIAFSIITKIITILVFQIQSIEHHYDINVYVTSSKEFADYGTVKEYADYCYSFSHMFWFAVFLSPLSKFFGVSQIAYSLFLAGILTAVSGLLFDIISFVCNKNIAFVIILVYILLPSQILLPQYVTHEIAALFFLSISLWLYFKIYKSTKRIIVNIFSFGGCIVSLVFCSAVNAQGIVAIICFIVIYALEFFRKKRYDRFLLFAIKTIVLIIAFIIGSYFMNSFQIQHSQLKSPQEDNKILWTLYVGSNYNSQGQWFPDEKWNNYQKNYSSEDIDSYHKSLIIQNYKELLNPITKLPALANNKMVCIWGDFSYSLILTNDTIPNKDLSKIYSGFLFKSFSFLNYVILLIITLIGCYCVWKYRKEQKNVFVVFCELFSLGTTMLLLIAECNNKYTIMVLPVFLITCAMQKNKDCKNA